LEREISDLKTERKEVGLSEAKQLSIDTMITALTQKETALTLEKAEIIKNTAGIVH
jgi:hypothetical protein